MARSASALPVHAAAGRTLRRAEVLRRGLGGGVALVASGAALGALAAPAAAAVPDVDLSYLRVLTAAELLKGDFQAKALASGKLDASATRLVRRMQADDKAHYTGLASLLNGAGQAAATDDDIDFSYPRGELRLARFDRDSRLEARHAERSARTSVRSRTSRPRPRGARSRRSRRTRRSSSSALAPFARPAHHREGVCRSPPDRFRLSRARRVRELIDAEADVHGERGGGRPRHQPRHAPPLGQGRPDEGRARRGATGASCRPPRSTVCAATAAARTSAPATASTGSSPTCRSTG